MPPRKSVPETIGFNQSITLAICVVYDEIGLIRDAAKRRHLGNEFSQQLGLHPATIVLCQRYLRLAREARSS